MKPEECIPGIRVCWETDHTLTGTLADPAVMHGYNWSAVRVVWDWKPDLICNQTMEYVKVVDEFAAWVMRVRENAKNQSASV